MFDAKFRVAIIGAGIGGFTLASGLHKLSKDISVDIYESAPCFTEFGAGIGIWPRPWEIIQKLGLEKDLLTAVSSQGGRRTQSFEYRKSDRTDGFIFYKHKSRAGFFSFQRAEMQAIIGKLLPKEYNIHFSKRLSSYRRLPSGEVQLLFEDQSAATCDVVIGCDGIKSAVRTTLYRYLSARAEDSGETSKASQYSQHARPMWTGTLAYRGLVLKDFLVKTHPGHYALTKSFLAFGKNKHVIVYPVSQGQLINIVAFVSEPELEATVYDKPWVRSAAEGELRAAFSTWEPMITDLLDCLENVSVWAVHTVSSLPTYVDEQVALLGDAAHAMAPHQGSGAGQAIEDAYILATILAHPSVSKKTLPCALQIYDEIRRPFSQMIVERSRCTGLVYQLHLEDEKYQNTDSLTAVELEIIGRKVQNLIEWVGNSSIMGDHDRALALLDSF